MKNLLLTLLTVSVFVGATEAFASDELYMGLYRSAEAGRCSISLRRTHQQLIEVRMVHPPAGYTCREQVAVVKMNSDGTFSGPIYPSRDGMTHMVLLPINGGAEIAMKLRARNHNITADRLRHVGQNPWNRWVLRRAY